MVSRPVSLAFIPPQMPTLVEKPPADGEWLHEIKFDGYRTQLIIDDDGVRMFTRNGHDWTARYRPLVLAAARLPVHSVILDGEVVVTGENGAADFAALRSAMANDPERLAFVAFDIMHEDGRDLRSLSLVERRAILKGIVPAESKIHFSEDFAGDGATVFKAIEAMGLEGMVSKRPDSRYRSGPSRAWLKVKCYEEAEFEVIGYLRKPGTAPQAYMAKPDGKRLYAGGAFVALNSESRDAFWKRAESLAGATPPKGIKRKDVQWLKPGLVGRVRYLKGEEELRHATLRDVWGERLADRKI